ncbi:hypothetical protein [Priestia sp. GS2]|uniref:hypothetical protein n=1 Tax=Priestia sp. GS2 TaxID=3117403 RepID=UPI002EDB6933
MNSERLIIGKVLSVDKIQNTEYGPKLICYMNILKTNFLDFEYTSTPVRVVIWREKKIQQFKKSFLHSKCLIMVTFDKHREDKDKFQNLIPVVRSTSISRISDYEFQNYYCTNAQGQFDPYSRLIS